MIPVKHHILVQKLESYGLRRQAAKLIVSYLSERSQFCPNWAKRFKYSQNLLWCTAMIDFGTTLVFFYNTDLPSHPNNGKSSLTEIAHDTSLTCSDKCSPIETVNNELTTITIGLINNRLILKVKKSSVLNYKIKFKKTQLNCKVKHIRNK